MSLVLVNDLRATRVRYGAANEEMQLLASRLNGRLSGRFSWWFFSQPAIEATHQGFRCRVFGMNQPWSGETNTSVSCIVELPQETPFRLRMGNVQQVSTNFFVNLERTQAVPRCNLPDLVLAKVFPEGLLQALQTLELPYELLINHDRITFTAFSLCEHSFYLRILDVLTEMARQLLESD